MSLSSFLKLPDVKNRFRQEFPVPKLASQKKLLAPPLSRRYPLVGTAFDYLLRFLVQRHNKNAIHRSWVAHEALNVLNKRAIGSLVYDIDRGEILTTDGKPFDTYKDPDLEKASRIINEACIRHERYISTGRLTDELIKTTIRLAQLDIIFRSGYIYKNLGRTYREDVRDLRNLIGVVKPRLFKAKNLCLLNPDFGNASVLVGGADADLLIDDVLIDVKTTKNLRLRPEMFFQLLGYFTLYQVGGIGNISPKPEITKLAIYFSRYSHLEVFEIDDLVNSETFPRFVEWFIDRAGQHSGAL